MPLTYTIDPRAGLVRLRYEGSVEIEEFETALGDIVEDRAFQPGFSFLLDRRGAQAPTRDYIRRAVSFARSRATSFGACRWAVVADSPEVYAMLSMGQILGGAVLDIEIFTDIHEAETWLREAR
jgi:hypothetical protein